MTLSDRIAALKELLPGLEELHYEALASEHPPINLNAHWLTDVRLPIVDVMVRLRFTDAKLLRVKQFCGAGGAELLDNCYTRFKGQLAKEELKDFTVALGVTAEADDPAAAAEVINSLNAERGNKPVMTFDLASVQTMLAAQAALKKYGFISVNTPMADAIRAVRRLTKRALTDKLGRTMDELLGVGPTRQELPHMLFRNGVFGDGTRMVEVTLPDGTTKQQRTSPVEPLVESLAGKSPVEIRAAIQARIEEVKMRSRRKKQQG